MRTTSRRAVARCCSLAAWSVVTSSLFISPAPAAEEKDKQSFFSGAPDAQNKKAWISSSGLVKLSRLLIVKNVEDFELFMGSCWAGEFATRASDATVGFKQN